VASVKSKDITTAPVPQKKRQINSTTADTWQTKAKNDRNHKKIPTFFCP